MQALCFVTFTFHFSTPPFFWPKHWSLHDLFLSGALGWFKEEEIFLVHLEHPHQYVQIIFHFAHLKPTFFYFIHLFLQNIYISLSIIHIYLNKIFIFLTLWTITMRGERREKRVRWREEREKKNKKIIYTVNSNRIYIHGCCSFTKLLYIFRYFYKNWCERFFD